MEQAARTPVRWQPSGPGGVCGGSGSNSGSRSGQGGRSWPLAPGPWPPAPGSCPLTVLAARVQVEQPGTEQLEAGIAAAAHHARRRAARAGSLQHVRLQAGPVGAALLAEDGVTIVTAGEGAMLRVFTPHDGGRTLRAAAVPDAAVGAPGAPSAPSAAGAAAGAPGARSARSAAGAAASAPGRRLSACVQLRGLDLLCVGGGDGRLHVYSVGHRQHVESRPIRSPYAAPTQPLGRS